MLEIIDSYQQPKIERPEEENNDGDTDRLGDDLESKAENAPFDAETVVKQEKTWMERLGGRAKEIAIIVGLLTAFSAGKATAEEIQAFAGHDSDQDKMEQVQKSESELLQLLETKNQEFLSSIPENILNKRIFMNSDKITAPDAGENIFIGTHYYKVDYMNPQNTGNVLNVERKSIKATVFGGAENIETGDEAFTIDGYGSSREEAVAKALEEAAGYMGTGVVLNSEKDTENQSTSQFSESEHTAAHYIKSYNIAQGTEKEEERPNGEKFYTVQIEVHPGKIAQQQ